MWQHLGKVTVGLEFPKKKNLKTRVLVVQGAELLLPQSLGLYLEPEFISVSSPTSGSRHGTHETASITIAKSGVWSYHSTTTSGKRRLQRNILNYRTHFSLFVRGRRRKKKREQSAKSLRPTCTAVSEGRSRWSGSLCCSSWCHTCSWRLCPCCPGCGSTSVNTGTIPDAGCMCTGRAATCPL